MKNIIYDFIAFLLVSRTSEYEVRYAAQGDSESVIVKLLKIALTIILFSIVLTSSTGCFEPEDEPCQGYISINNGAESTFSREVEIYSNIIGATEMYFREYNGSSEGYKPFSETKNFTLSEGYGVKTVRGYFNNTDCVYYDTIILLDPDARKFSINKDSIITNSINTTFGIEVRKDEQDPEVMRFSNDNSEWSEWEPYSESREWVLPEGYGKKQVYAEFRFAGGETIQLQNEILLIDASEISTSNYSNYSDFGISLAISGNGDVFVAGTGSNAFHVFRRLGDSWDETTLTILYGDPGNGFGRNVAVSSDGNVIATAVTVVDKVNGKSGVVYIYKWNGSAWEETKLFPFGSLENYFFGTGISISQDGRSVIVTAQGNGKQEGSSGIAYLFKNNGSAWSETRLEASSVVDGEKFGASVSMSSDGNTIVIGAPNRNSDTVAGLGLIYIFKWIDSSWVETKFLNENSAYNDSFGHSVAISSDGNTIIAGAPCGYLDEKNSGSAIVYKWIGASWSKTKFSPLANVDENRFGSSVSISSNGNKIVIGSLYSDDRCGSLYVYEWNGSEWESIKLAETVRTRYSHFGQSAAVSSDGNSIVAGAPKTMVQNANRGLVYYFNLF